MIFFHDIINDCFIDDDWNLKLERNFGTTTWFALECILSTVIFSHLFNLCFQRLPLCVIFFQLFD